MDERVVDRFPDLALRHAPLAAHLVAWLHRSPRSVWLALAMTSAATILFLGARALFVLVPLWLSTLVALPLRTGGASMLPTLGRRSFGLVLRGPLARCARGDLVVLVHADLRPLVKRLAAVAGDRVRFHGGRVWVNGELQPLPADITQLRPELEVELEVPEGKVFVLGDHVASIDSRQLGLLPRSAVMGRYLPISRGYRDLPCSVAMLREPERADVEALRRLGSKHVAQLEAALAVGEVDRARVWLILRWAWREVGDGDGLARLLARAERESEGRDRAFFALHLAQLRVERGEHREALALLERSLHLAPPPERAYMASLRAATLARLGRYDEALEACDELGAASAGVRVSALLGLGRVDEARRALDAVGDELPWARPFYTAYVATADGDLERAATLVRAALDAGFTGRRWLEATPHLEALRASPYWSDAVAQRAQPASLAPPESRAT